MSYWSLFIEPFFFDKKLNEQINVIKDQKAFLCAQLCYLLPVICFVHHCLLPSFQLLLSTPSVFALFHNFNILLSEVQLLCTDIMRFKHFLEDKTALHDSPKRLLTYK